MERTCARCGAAEGALCHGRRQSGRVVLCAVQRGPHGPLAETLLCRACVLALWRAVAVEAWQARCAERRRALGRAAWKAERAELERRGQQRLPLETGGVRRG